MTGHDRRTPEEQQRELDYEGLLKARRRKAADDELRAAIRAVANDPGLPGRSDRWKRIGLPPKASGWTREDVREARRRWQLNPSQKDYSYLPASKTTLMRLRHKFGLVPWPEEYRHPIP
jgi:hypothetical protein